MKTKTIICHECKQPILHKADLAVVGKAFIPYHEQCFEKIKHKNIYAFFSGYKSNGKFPWIMLILFNSAIWSSYYFFHAPLNEVMTLSLFITAMTLFFRLIAYLFYERYLD